MDTQIKSLFYPDDIEIFYQYRSLQVFIEMVKNKQLWLTDITKMNDDAEEKWTTRLIDAVCIKMEDNSIESFYKKIYESYLSCSRTFICCFSEEGDILSQWRAYADDGKGFAIGFSSEMLKNIKTIPKIFAPHYVDAVKFFKVFYAEEDKCDWMTDYIKSIQAEAAYQGSFNEIDRLSWLASAIKNPAFKEEKEWRLVFQLTDQLSPQNQKNMMSEVSFRPTSKGLSPYFTHDFCDKDLKEVCLGPKNESTIQDIEWFLKKHGFSDVKVTKSSATYR